MAGNGRAEAGEKHPNTANVVTASKHEARAQPMTFPMQRSGHSDLTSLEIADRLDRELIDAYAYWVDRRDVEGQMSPFTADTESLVYMDSRNAVTTERIYGPDDLRPVFASLSALCRIAPTRNWFHRQGIVRGAASSCECHTTETRCTRSAGVLGREGRIP